jgi:hypothetical protein
MTAKPPHHHADDRRAARRVRQEALARRPVTDEPEEADGEHDERRDHQAEHDDAHGRGFYRPPRSSSR